MENPVRQKLHELIDNFPEERLQEVYELLQEEEYPDDMKQMLEEEYNDYQKNGEVISRDDVNSVILQMLDKSKA